MAQLIVRFIKTSGLISDGIALWTDSLWDHTELGTPEETWLGARDDGGVQERFPTYCVPIRERRYALDVTDAQLATVMVWARSKVGTPYNFGDIAGLFIHDRYINSPGKMICSMFVLEAMMQVFTDPLPLNVTAGYTNLITPEDLHLSPLFAGKCIYSLGV